MDKELKIIGIGGLPRSGKDALAELFMADNFFGVSFGDIVRGFTRKRHSDKPDPISVANMTETSNWLRQTRGADVVLQEALRQFKEAQATGKAYRGLVLWSIRAPVEVDFILERGGSLIWLEASPEVRHQRAVESLRQGELPISLAEFKRQEALQWQPQPDPSVPLEAQMDLSYVRSHATHTLANDGDNLEVFLQEGRVLIKALGA